MRTKLATVLIIPSVAFVVLAGAQTYALAGQSSQLSDFAEEVSVGRPITDLVHRLQVERDRSIGELAAAQVLPAGSRNPTALTATMRPHYDGVDAAVSTFRLAAAPLAGGRAAWRVSYGRTDEALGQRSQLRSSVAAGAVSPTAVASGYGAMIDALLNLLAQPSPGLERPELTDAVLRYVDLARVKDVSSRLRAKLYQAASAGRYGPTDLAELSDLRAQQLSALAEFRAVATDDQLRRFDEAARDSRFRAATALEESTLSGTTVLPAPQWWQASGDRQDLLRSVEVGILDDAVRQADNRSSAQLRQTLLVAGIILVILVVALITSVAIGRSIARSLRSLREHALRVARADLPDTLAQLRSVTAGVPEIEVAPAPVHSLDEVGEVADAFLAVHRSAVNLAVEQTVMRRNVNSMFVNLARRSQVLVERQLELLDELERDQADPDQLENLFKIDHLAARMRRNDESLLVLAGNESNRRWSEPVPLSTVVLAAIAEIEFYPRVQPDTDDDLHVVGHAVADLVHLLAELLENATLFSPPHTTVSLAGRAFTGGVAVLEIADEGLGMTPRALREANHLLISPPAADVAASERMGLFVVSHLAARQGIRVQLRAAERGLVATVWLPRTVLADPAQHLLAPASAIMSGGGRDVVPAPFLPPPLATAPMSSGVADRPAIAAPGAIAAAVPGPAAAPIAAAPAVPPMAVPPETAAPPMAVPLATAVPVPGMQPSPMAARPSITAPVQPAGPAAPAWLSFHDAVTTELQVVSVRPEVPGRADAADDGDVPVAGRRPRRVVQQRTPARTGAPRAENVLRAAGGGPADNSSASDWWSRPDPVPLADAGLSAGPDRSPAALAGSSAGPDRPPAAPAGSSAGPDRPPVALPAGGFNARGLPVRIPMAQLPASGDPTSASAYAPAGHAEPDPDAVGRVLSRFYGGVRRAEAEATTQIPMAPVGRRSEGT